MVLAAMLGAGIGAGATPAFAGWLPGASLGLEVTTPKDADRDDELLGTAKVQASLKNLNTYKSSAVAMRASFQKDTNAALIPAIRKYFDFAVLRTDLNTLGSVFDDQTQETLRTAAQEYDIVNAKCRDAEDRAQRTAHAAASATGQSESKRFEAEAEHQTR